MTRRGKKSGDARIEETAAVSKEPIPGNDDHCPIVALGHRDGVFYFINSAGEMRGLGARDMTLLGIGALFGGDIGWLRERYSKYDKRDHKTGEIEVQSAALALMRRCVNVGLFDPSISIRSVGVWRDGDQILAHCGDAVFYFEKEKRRRRPAGARYDNVIYVAAPPIEPPASQTASREQARMLFTQIGTLWNFAAPHLSRMVFGFVVSAMLGAAPGWRVHILLIGKRGAAGKSTLLRLIRAALGPQATYTNDPTEAGMRESLSNEARAIVFDEAGARGGEDRTSRVSAIIGLVRRMAGDEGARSVRGTGGAGTKRYVMAGSVVLAAANAPTLDAQDRSRILEVDMLEKIFERTSWRKGAWSRALKGLPGALACGPHQSQRFAGPKQRFTVVPQQHLPDRPRKPADGWPKSATRPPGPPGPV